MHLTLTDLAESIDRINESLGRLLAWAALLLILVQFGLVLMTYVFSVGSIRLQESRLYINSLIFLGAAGYTLLHDEQVRVDLFYRDADSLAKAWVNFAGTLVLLAPFIVLLWWNGVPYVMSAWAIGEGSIETTGLQFVYVLKTFLLLFAASLSLQAVSVLLRSGAQIFSRQERG